MRRDGVMQSWRSRKFGHSATSRRSMTPRAGVAVVSLGVLLALLQGCSSTPDTAVAPSGAAQPPPKTSGFDADGPPSGTYRGGRDPVTGKAAEWSPNGPVETSAIAPLPSPGRPVPVARAAPSPQLPAASAGIGLQGKFKVRQGDTLDSIAQAHGITVTALMQANRMTGRTIKVGQQLVIPQ